MARDYARRTKLNSRPVKRQNSKKTNPEGRLWILACVLIGLFIVALVFLKKEGAKIPHNPAVDDTSQPKAVAKKPASTPQPRFDFYTILPKGQTSSSATTNTPHNTDAAPQERAPAPAVPPPTPPDLNTSSDQPAPPPPAAAAPPAPVAEDDMASTSPTPTNKDTDATNKPTANTKDEVAELEKQQLASESQQSSSATDKAVTTTYVIQLGIFKDFTAADQLKAQLAMQGIEAKIKNIKKSNTVYYRVWIGPYTNHSDASNKQQDLKNSQIKSSIIKNTD